jgi:hypothetical protein
MSGRDFHRSRMAVPGVFEDREPNGLASALKF